MDTIKLENKVETYRKAGLEAKWTKHKGTPFIALRNPQSKLKHQRDTWWLVTKQVFDCMKRDGIVEGFNNATLLGDIFSI